MNAVSEVKKSEYEANIGKIVRYLWKHHRPGDWGDGSVNHPIVSIIDSGGSAAIAWQQHDRTRRGT